VYWCGGAEEYEGSDGEEEKDGDAAAALPQAVAPVGAPSVLCCGGVEKRKGCDGDAATPVGARTELAANTERQIMSSPLRATSNTEWGLLRFA
jgi:hypothetical protein